MDVLLPLRDDSPNRIVGLMSGTSLDGVDATLATVEGHGPSLSVTQEAFAHTPYPTALRERIHEAATNDASVQDVARLHVRLAHAYATALDTVLADAGQDPAALDLVGCHGQTVQHLPDATEYAGESVRVSLQLGNPSTLANRIDVPVVGDFRAADLARGGQGAPLVPYFDYACFTDADEPRGLLNLGGIANLTVLPAGASRDDVRAFDTGPANMVLDVLARRLFDVPMDRDGTHAAQGTPDHDLLADLLSLDYFHREPPKSTGRTDFGPDFVDDLLGAAQSRGLSAKDTLATATLLSAGSVYQAYARYIRPEQSIERVVVSGGGVHNDTLMHMLSDAFAPIPVESIAEHGVNPDAKEALCFAVLAHETVHGVPTSLPSVTGASAASVLGSISIPG
jgi:anhydro-N-acetylmuramic acid kinase